MALNLEISNESTSQPQTILIVDDNPTNLGVIADYLETYGFKVLMARCGETGLEKAQFARPDLILLDVMLPGIDGFEVCRRLKATETTKDIPVIFMTVLTETEPKLKGFQVGAVDYITKPFQQAEVLARVATHLRLRELTEQLEQKVQARTRELAVAYQQLQRINDEFARQITERKQAEESLRQSEEKYRSLITNIPDVTWTTDYEGHTTFVSPNIETAYGYTPAEIYKSGDSLWLGEIYPDDVENVKQAYITLFEKGTKFDIEYRIKRKDGQWIWAHDRSVATYKKDGTPYADGIFVDITERKRVEEALRKIEERLRSFMEASPDSFILLDSELNIVEVNEAGLKALGKTKEEVIGKNILAINPAVKETGRYDEYLAVMKTGVPFLTDDFIPHPRFGDLHVDVKAFKVGDSLGIIVTDITERKQAEEKLRKHREHLEEMVAERTAELRKMVNLMAGREVRMAGLKKVIEKLRAQLQEAGLTPVADDPLLGGQENVEPVE